MSDDGAPDSAGVAFAAGVASQRSQEAEETADNAAAAAQTAVAVAEAGSAAAQETAADAVHVASQAQEDTYDLRTSLEDYQARTDGALGEILNHLRGNKTGDDTAPAPERKTTPPPAEQAPAGQGGETGGEAPPAGKPKRKKREDGMSSRWFGED